MFYFLYNNRDRKNKGFGQGKKDNGFCFLEDNIRDIEKGRPEKRKKAGKETIKNQCKMRSDVTFLTSLDFRIFLLYYKV